MRMGCGIQPPKSSFLCRVSQTQPHHVTSPCSSPVAVPKSRIYRTAASRYKADDTATQISKTQTYTVKFESLGSCKLGISRYPDFEYNAQGGTGTGTGLKRAAAAPTVDSSHHNKSSNNNDDICVAFDLNTLYIPPLTTATTKFLGLPLPPFLRIDIAPDALRGRINQETGQVDLEFKAKFWFSVGRVYKAPPLVVGTVLTSEESRGSLRGGKGERLDQGGKCRLVGVATVQPIDDSFMNSFLGLPTECLAQLNAIITLSKY